MSKRPALSAETVVRKSRLATKGEAVPALVHGQHNHQDHPATTGSAAPVIAPVVAPAVVEAVAPEPRPVAPAPSPAAVPAVPVEPAATAPAPVVDGLLAALADRDRQLEQLRSDLLKAEQERSEERARAAKDVAQLDQLRADLARVEAERSDERAAAAQDHDQMVANLAAADATIDELRNRLGDLRAQLEQSRAETTRTIEQHMAERQVLLDHHKAECERLMALATQSAASGPSASAPPSPPAAPALGGAIQSARRWLFGDEPTAKAPPASPRPAPAKLAPAAPPAAPASGAAKPSVVKPVGPPTAPKVLNRRPVG